jgi:hypothetical protein
MSRVFRRSFRALSWEELLALTVGPKYDSADPDGERWRPLWESHQQEVMTRFSGPGRRPWAWWRFDAPEPRNDELTESYQLANLDELTDAEIKILTPEWRRHFDRSFDPDFFYCRGPDDFLEGEEAREALYAWAGIPRAILDQWTTKRERQAKVIRKLQRRRSRRPN